MITTAIDNSKKHLLKDELQAKFPQLKLQSSDSIESIISKISLISNQNEEEISRIIEEQLVYVNSKSL